MFSNVRSNPSLLLCLLSGAWLASPVTLAETPSDAAKRVDTYLQRLVPYGFSGAVLIARDGRVELRRGYGRADREKGVAYSPEMVSDIGSVTKQFTAAGILKLEEMGRLKTSDLLSAHLPGVPEDKAGITLHHLLTHTAGLPGGNLGEDEDAIARDELVKQVMALPLDSKPGDAFQYSNEGYALLGVVIERVSGLGYEEFMTRHLWAPAGMKNTGYLVPAWSLERLPVGYNAEGEPWGRTYKNGWLADGPGWYLRANGGVHSTVDDLLRWHEALASGRVLKADTVARYEAGHVSSVGAEKYGYGWGISQTRRGTSVVSHNGGNGYFFTDFRRYRDEGVVIIAMTNQPAIPATQLARREIESLYFGGAPVVEPPVPVGITAAQRAALVGTFRAEDGTSVTIAEVEGAIEATSSDPLLFGTLGALSPPGGRFKAIEDRSLGILAACALGDFKTLHEAFVDGRPLSVVEGNQKRIWAQWREEFGEFEKMELLGTGVMQGDPAVTVRLRFARGGPLLRLAWGPRRLLAFMIMPGAPPASLVAASPTDLVYYRYGQTEGVSLRFNGSELTVRAGSKSLRATRQN